MKQESGFDLAKALSFVLAFVAFSMIIGVGFLVPTVRSIGKQNTLLAIETKSFKAVKEKFDEEDGKLTNLKKENAVVIKAMGTNFIAADFQKNNQAKYQMLLQQTDSAKEDAFSIVEYNIGMNFTNTKELFDFLDGLDRTGSLIKIQTPLSISNTANGLATNYYIRSANTDLGVKKETNTTTNH